MSETDVQETCTRNLQNKNGRRMDLVTTDRYSEEDCTIFYDLIFEINSYDDWIVEGPHVLRAIKVKFSQMYDQH